MGLIPNIYKSDEPRKLKVRVFDVQKKDEVVNLRDGSVVNKERLYLGVESPETGRTLQSIRFNLSSSPRSPWRMFWKRLEELGMPREVEFEEWILNKVLVLEERTFEGSNVSFNYWYPLEVQEYVPQEVPENDAIRTALMQIFNGASVLPLSIYQERVVTMSDSELMQKLLDYTSLSDYNVHFDERRQEISFVPF